MQPERWRRVEEIFHGALKHDGAARAAFLADACAGDSALRHDVESLLEQPNAASGLLAGDDGVTGLPLAVLTPHVELVGRRIGPYQLQSLIGAGGMGEVYRARDTKLGRDVAIKILPRAFTSDADRLARFEREARVLASLNHPNIAAIYGVEDDDGMRALVLELVEGETLADRVSRGALSATDAVAIALQIAAALEAAHETGIVHRDLKPANITITPGGLVKVLDFGLAKLGTGNSGSDLTHSPTVTIGGTHDGVILGTAAYMSPEQARGQLVDKRTDIWSFGCVLYEMLAGRTVFGRATVSDTIAAILEREPDYSALPGNLPPNARRLLQRCLVKDARMRLRDIGDARLEFSAPGDDASDRHAIERRSRFIVLNALVAAALVLAAALAWARWPRSVVAVDGFSGRKLDRLTYDSGVTRNPVFSPDGRLLAFASDRAGTHNLDIWVQQVNGGVPLRLTDDPSDDREPRFSPDGSQIVFRSDRDGGGVYIVPALGGTPRLIARDGRGPRFSPDGTRIAYWVGGDRGNAASSRAQSFIAPLSGGVPVRVLKEFSTALSPVWSPDGRSLLILGRRNPATPAAESFDWWWVPLDDRTPVKTGILDLPGFRLYDPVPPDWSASAALFSDSMNLWSIPISSSTGKIDGEPRQLTFGTGAYLDPAAAPDSTIAFAAMTGDRAVERQPLDGNQSRGVVRLYSDGQPVAGRVSSTRDGSLIAFERDVQNRAEIWLKNVRTGSQSMLISVESKRQLNATLSQDGARVAYTISADNEAVGEGLVLETAGGLPKKVCTGCGLHGFLSDNRRVLAQVAGGRSLRLFDTSNGSEQILLTTPDSTLDRPHASPDDRWIAFRESGKTLVTRLSPGLPPPKERWMKVEEPTTSGRPMGWSLGSDIVYLLLDTDGFRCVYGQRINTTTGALLGTPYAVLHFHSEYAATNGVSTSFGNAVDEQGFIYEMNDRRSDIWKLTPARQPAR